MTDQGRTARQPTAAPTRPLAILSFDVEEFDLPTEVGRPLPFDEQIRLSEHGLHRVLALLDKHRATATFFTTAVFARARPALVREIAQRHEIASHAFRHDAIEPGDAARSRETLQEITHAPVVGFRRPRMGPIDAGELAAAGYLYDSSLHPTWLPGRYNHLREPRVPHWRGHADARVLEIPASVGPTLRLPAFWLAFRHFPAWIYRANAARILRADGVLNHYFHPWEFAPIAGLGLPWLPSRGAGEPLVARLDAYMGWLGSRATWTTFAAYARGWIDEHGSAPR